MYVGRDRSLNINPLHLRISKPLVIDLHQLYATLCYIERSKPYPPPEIVASWGARDNGDSVLDELERKFMDDNDLEKYVLPAGVGR